MVTTKGPPRTFAHQLSKTILLVPLHLVAKNNKQYQIVYQFVCYGSKEFFVIVVVDFEAAIEYMPK